MTDLAVAAPVKSVPVQTRKKVERKVRLIEQFKESNKKLNEQKIYWFTTFLHAEQVRKSAGYQLEKELRSTRAKDKAASLLKIAPKKLEKQTLHDLNEAIRTEFKQDIPNLTKSIQVQCDNFFHIHALIRKALQDLDSLKRWKETLPTLRTDLKAIEKIIKEITAHQKKQAAILGYDLKLTQDLYTTIRKISNVELVFLDEEVKDQYEFTVPNLHSAEEKNNIKWKKEHRAIEGFERDEKQEDKQLRVLMKYFREERALYKQAEQIFNQFYQQFAKAIGILDQKLTALQKQANEKEIKLEQLDAHALVEIGILSLTMAAGLGAVLSSGLVGGILFGLGALYSQLEISKTIGKSCYERMILQTQMLTNKIEFWLIEWKWQTL